MCRGAVARVSMNESERDNTPTDLVTPPEGYEHHGLDYEAPVIPIDRESRKKRGRRGGGDGPQDPPESKRNVRIRKLRVLGILFFLGLLVVFFLWCTSVR